MPDDEDELTGALGLITTLGANGWPLLWGVPGPEAPPLPVPKLCCPPKCGPLPSEPAPAWPGWEPEFDAEPSPPGRGLLRASARWVCDEEGVAWAEPEGDWVP